MHRQPRSSNTGRFVKRKSAKRRKKATGTKHHRRRGTLARILGL